MGLFSFIGGLIGGNAQKKDSQNATNAQVTAYNRATDIGNQQFQQTRDDYQPYTTAGGDAITQLSALINGGMTPEQLTATIKGNPLYGATYNAGEEALLQNAAATGGLRGGNTQLGLADFGANTLANVYSTIKSDLGGLASLGLGATGQVSQFGAQNAASAGQNAVGIGSAQANNYLARGRINAQNWQNAGSFLDSAVSAGLPGGGGLSAVLKGIF